MELREVCFHGEKRVQKRKHIMPGSSFQKWKYREITVGIGGHIYVEVVTEKNSIPDESPIPSCSLAESNGVCSCRKDSRFSYNHRSVFSAAAQQSGQGCRHQARRARWSGWINPFWIERSRNCC